MDIIIKKQETADVIICVPLVINTGLPDTAATVTIKAINPNGTENTTFTAPSVTEVIATSGVYRLTFSTAAANKLFTQEDTANPYTLLIKTATSGSTGYRAVRIYCSTKMPSEYATSASVSAVSTLVDALPILSEIEASSVLAKAATVATAANLANLPTLANIEASSVLAKEATVSSRPILSAIEASTVLAKEATVSARPTLATIEASTVIAKEASVSAISAIVTFTKKMFTNRKTLTAAGSVYSLNVFDTDDSTPILTKIVKDVSGADISAPAAGVISRELKSSV